MVVRRRATLFLEINSPSSMFIAGYRVFGVDVWDRGANAINAIWSEWSDCPRAWRKGRLELWIGRGRTWE